MMYDEVIIRKRRNDLYKGKCSLFEFITQYMDEGRYDLVRKLGFNYRKFKEAGGILNVSSLEVDFNFPVRFTNEMIIKIELIDIKDSRIHIASLIYNKGGFLLAKAMSTFACSNTKMLHSNMNLYNYFKNVDSKIDEYATY